MQAIADLIAKIRLPGLEEREKRAVCATTLSVLLKVPLSPDQVTIKEGIISLRVPPVLRSAAALHFENAAALLRAQGIVLTALQ